MPLPEIVTLSGYVGTKVAVTARDWFVVTRHDPTPLQAPDQPVKAYPVAGVALRVTVVTLLKVWLQVPDEQAMSGAGVECTLPLPDTVTLRVYEGMKVAVTMRG